MRIGRFLLLSFLCLVVCKRSCTQQLVTSDPEALKILQLSLGALSGGRSVTDVTLVGSVHYIAGSDDRTGSVTYVALPSFSRMEMIFAEGKRLETQSTAADVPFGQWSTSDGATHDIAQHNVLTDPGWLSIFILTRFLPPQAAVLTFVGNEIRNDVSVLHITAYREFPDVPGEAGSLLAQGSKVQIYLDSSSLFPIAIAFNAHAEDDLRFSIPSEIRFSDYRFVSGVNIPFHIQKFFNNSLTHDLRFSRVVLNTGITAAQFSAQ